MVRPISRLVAVVIAFAFSTTAYAQATKVTHEFACCDYNAGKVFLVNSEGAITWEHKAPSSNDLWVLPNGNLLFTTGHGVLEVTRDKKEVFKYESRSEIYACQRLPSGNTFVGECNAGRLLEVDPAGKIVKEVRLLPEGKDGGHLYMRNARRLADGHYLVAHYGLEVVREYDADGKTVAEFKAPGGPHSVVRLINGNTLIALADQKKDAKVVEYDKEGKLVWEVSNKDLPDAPLWFSAGLQRLPNGNTMICNWLGHGHLGKAPHVLEVTPDKKLVWTYANHKDMKTISTIQVLEVGGDATKGEVQH
jgi:hypothetical protein